MSKVELYYKNAQESIKKLDYEKAIEYYLNIISYEPNNINVLNEIGTCYFNLSNYKEAMTYFYKLLKNREISIVYNNIGNCFANMKKYKLAEINFLKSYNIDNNDDSKKALGTIYYYMKKYDASLQFLKEIKNIDSHVLHSMSLVYLSKKNFKKGFELYENRLVKNDINRQTGSKDRVELPEIPFWNGKEKCNRLLVVYEQGIGDNIQYFRFIIELSNKYPNMNITYFCKSTLTHIFKKYENITIIDKLNNIDMLKYEYKVFIMSLPKILKLSNIEPNKDLYINVDNNKLIYWKDKLNHLKKFKVGFVYNGLLTSFIEKYIPLNEFEKLCDLDIDLICIQKKNEIENDLLKINFKDNMHIFNIDVDVPFDDTIHILKNIDLLITIDTYIAHLAGVLNVETWLLLGYSEWRWSNDETKTYWYNSVELIRRHDKEEYSELKDLIYKVKDKLQDKIKNINC
jgi:ADP-heptose:LPS heptosyltransferase